MINKKEFYIIVDKNNNTYYATKGDSNLFWHDIAEKFANEEIAEFQRNNLPHYKWLETRVVKIIIPD